MKRSPPPFRRNRPHCVYRVFSANGDLLYIGCTFGPLTRILNHARSKPWRTEIANITLDWFENWNLADKAETAAIQSEKPIWNVHHKPTERIQARGIYDPEYRHDDPSTWIVKVSA